MYIRKKIKELKYYFRFRSEMAAFKQAGGHITRKWAIYSDYIEQAGTASGHYFHQDLLVATFINRANPTRHIDVGSRMDGFVAHVASFREIEVIDVRPLKLDTHPQIKFRQVNLINMDPTLLNYCDSLSCLHAIEHFGLGRYGDPIDPTGHIKGIKNFHKILKASGTLYISFPIGESAVLFNAHRVFSPCEILGWVKDLFKLKRFDYVDDIGNLHCDVDIKHTPKLTYGCGIYTFEKIN
jgi:hypothetical protein